MRIIVLFSGSTRIRGVNAFVFTHPSTRGQFIALKRVRVPTLDLNTTIFKDVHVHFSTPRIRVEPLYYPNATQILDWYHASQYLYKIADDAFEAKSDNYKNWIEKTKTMLWDGQIEQLIAECESFADKPTVSKAVHAALSFYTNFSFAKSGVKVVKRTMKSSFYCSTGIEKRW